MVGVFLPAAILQVTAADEAWCECGGSDTALPQRGRSSNNNQWLIPNMEPLMIYLFGNYRALGELGAIDNKTQEPGEGILRDLTLLSHQLCFWKHVCIYCLLHQKNCPIGIF